MNKTSILVAAVALLLAATAFPTHSADRRYPISYVRKMEITEPSGQTAWERKDFLDCSDVVLTDADVLYALRHMRRISWSAYDPEKTDTTGCVGDVLVTFKNGRVLAMGIEPTGRILALEYDAKMEPTGTPTDFYECDPCRTRKMALLKDAQNRADERRLKRLVAEGALSASEAERRLNWARAERAKP